MLYEVITNSFFSCCQAFIFRPDGATYYWARIVLSSLFYVFFFLAAIRFVDQARKAAKYWIGVTLSTDTFRKTQKNRVSERGGKLSLYK